MPGGLKVGQKSRYFVFVRRGSSLAAIYTMPTFIVIIIPKNSIKVFSLHSSHETLEMWARCQSLYCMRSHTPITNQGFILASTSQQVS